MGKKIKMEFVQTDYHSCFPCNVCGGHTGNVSVLCVCAEGDFEGLRICEICLKEGDIDGRLEARAARLEASAAMARQLIGRIKAPSYENWKKVWHAVRFELAHSDNEEVPF